MPPRVGRQDRKTRFILGSVSAPMKILASPRLRREWLIIQCDFADGVPLVVLWGEGLTLATFSHVYLQPGESMVFSRSGDMPWEGAVWVQGDGGTAGYRGGEAYFE